MKNAVTSSGEVVWTKSISGLYINYHSKIKFKIGFWCPFYFKYLIFSWREINASRLEKVPKYNHRYHTEWSTYRKQMSSFCPKSPMRLVFEENHKNERSMRIYWSENICQWKASNVSSKIRKTRKNLERHLRRHDYCAITNLLHLQSSAENKPPLFLASLPPISFIFCFFHALKSRSGQKFTY